MAIALVVTTPPVRSNSVSATTASINTTGSNLLVLHIGTQGTGAAQLAPACTVSDSKGNTWTALQSNGVNNQDGCFFYCLNPTVGSGHTFTVLLGTASWISISAHGFSGVATSGALGGQNKSTVAYPTTSLATGSVTPTVDGSLVMAELTYANLFNSATVPTINSGFTILQTYNPNVQAPSTCVAYLIQGAAAAVNPTFTFPASAPAAVTSIAVFAPQTSGLQQLAALGAG